MSLPLARRIAINFIHFYQTTFSPDHGPLRCLFPEGVCVHRETCSDYGKRIIAECGVLRGTLRTAWRILCCRESSERHIRAS